MGRGRAKAKQTKVARELKYSSGGRLDPERLKAELASGSPFPTASSSREDDEDDDFEDPYADAYADDEDDDEDAR